MLHAKMIGNKIAEARKKINTSQAELARQLFISAQAVGKWERGESMPDITTLNRLAELLGVDLNYFSESFSVAPATSPIPLAQQQDNLLSQPVEPLPPEKQPGKLSRDMSRGNWVDADFSGLKNLHEKFSSSNMQRCQFIGSDLSGLLLKRNNVTHCDFSGSDFSGSHIQGSYLSENNFKDCSMKDAEFSASYASGCDFSRADFTGAVIRSGGFEKNNMADAVLHNTSFIETGLDDIVFEGKLEDCHFENCSFKWLTFRNATLINTFFRNNRFKWIRLRFIDCQADRLTYQFLKSERADVTGITLLPS